MSAETVAVNVDQIPAALRERPQWVGWTYKNIAGKSKPTKIPHDIKIKTSVPCSITDPASWSSFELATAAIANGHGYSGIGFCLKTGGGIVGFDFDNCINDDGSIAPWANEFIRRLDSYAEISPSGRGVRVFLFANVLSFDHKKQGNFEVYTDERYLTVTGNHLPGTPAELEHREGEFLSVHTEVFPPQDARVPAVAANHVIPSGVTDEMIIQKTLEDARANQMWQGDTAGLPSLSESHLSLIGRIAFFAGPDESRIDRIFSQSPAAEHYKWSARQDYRERTIAKALANKIDFYHWNGNGQPVDDDSSTPILVNLATVEPQKVRWLWPRRIPAGKITVACGDPGLGKSFFTVDATARVTRGIAWPDGSICPQGSVIILSAEDDIADTIVPRLIASGGDRSKVSCLTAVQTKKSGKRSERSVTLADIGVLQSAIQQSPDCRLVIIDPVSAYQPEGKDSHKNAEMRTLLKPLATVAANTGVAIFVITHLSKGEGARAMYRAMGSIALLAAARAAWLMAKEKGNEDRRLFLPIKNNLGDDKTGFAFRIEGDEQAAHLVWEDNGFSMKADDALAADMIETDGRAEERSEAVEFLKNLLSDGRKTAKEVHTAANDAGISKRDLNKAKLKIGVKPKRHSTGNGGAGEWFWEYKHDDIKPLLEQANRKARSSVRATDVEIVESIEVLGNLAKDEMQESQEEQESQELQDFESG